MRKKTKHSLIKELYWDWSEKKDYFRPKDLEFRQLQEKIKKAERQMEVQFSSENYALLEKYIELQVDSERQCLEEAYYQGFCYGMRLAAEAFLEDKMDL